MARKERFVFSLLITCMIFFMAQNGIAGSGWQEDQKQMFSRVSVKPGDVIDKTNCEKVKDLLPEEFLNVVKKGDWILNIGEFGFDYDWDEDYYKLSAENEGRYVLGDKKEILDVKTGQPPMFIQGMPFPDIDFKTDPDAAVKFMHNRDVNNFRISAWKADDYSKWGNLMFIGRKGYERGVMFSNEIYNFWNRTGGETPNPRKLKYTNFLVSQAPFDLKGTATLYLRHLDGRADDMYVYVPAIRRVKRLSGANRSDPQMGSDQTADDWDGFGGHIESMKWTYMGKKVILKPLNRNDAKAPRELKQNKDGGWEFQTTDSCELGFMKDGWTGAPWAYVNHVWIPTEMVIIKATPLDPFYAYGDMILYFDAKSTTCAFNLKYTKAGEFWKYIVVASGPGTWKGGQKILTINGASCVVDVKTDHASPTHQDGYPNVLDSPRVNPENHTPQNLKTATK
jgi:hypothetical protein